MEDLLSKIYDKVVCEESDSVQFGKEFDAIVKEMIEPLRSGKEDAEVEEIKELIYRITYFAEKYGFVIGVRFTGKLLTEVMKTRES